MPRPPASRWTSFVAGSDHDRPRVLSEQGNPTHRLRVGQWDDRLARLDRRLSAESSARR